MLNFKETDGNSSGKSKMKTFIIGVTLFLLAAVSAFLVISFLDLGDISGRTIRIMLIILLVPMGLLLGAIRAFFSALDMIDRKAKVISKGNLNVSDVVLEKARGLENLTLALNDMKSNFLSFIELTKGNIVTLSNAIEQVSSSIETNYGGNQQIASSMNLVAEKAQQQLMLVKETLSDVENSDSRIQKITDSIKGIEEYIEGTVKTTEVGTKNLDLFYDQLNTMSSHLDGTNRFMQELNGEIGNISNIGEFIIQVSQQLKLLSLNASIEAAKAGEAGRGFAVVSNEIRDLSSKTHESMQKIDGIVSEVMKRSENVNSSISGFIGSFNESREIFEKVRESLGSINHQSGTINKGIKGIYNEINLIGSFTRGTKEKGIELHAASDEISSRTHDVAAVTEETLAGLEEITAQTSALNNMLSNIQQLVNKFNTSVLPAAKTSQKKLKLACLSIQNNEFWDSIKNGVTYAQKELARKNAAVDFFGFDSSYEGSLADYVGEKLKYCIDNGYDGITMPGFFANDNLMIKEVNRKSIPVMAFNCDFSDKALRLACFGPNNHEGGKLAGRLMAKALQGEGNIIIVRGNTQVSESRRSGMIDALKKYKNIKIVDDFETIDNAEQMYSDVKKYLSKNRNIKGICIAGGGVEGGAKAVEELGLSDSIRLVGYDHTKEIYQYIKEGIIYAAIGQDTFGQGHDPLIWLYNLIVAGDKIPDDMMYLRLDVVDSRNVNDLL